MSGGSHDYICYKLSEECEEKMHDAELNDMVKDFIKVLHDLEWWQSGDCSEEEYRETVNGFKKKWFNGDRETRLKGYINEQIENLRGELYALVDERRYEE